MSHKQLDKFLRLLRASPSGPVFNPWWQIDRENDIGSNCPAIRRKHLTAYFRERLVDLGGHVSGSPMTSERMLLGKKPEIVAALHQRRTLGLPGRVSRRSPLQIIAGINPRRTSKPSVCQGGFSEPTATIVWGALLKIGVLPNEFVLWNAFPWHSFDPHRGLLSNRMPNKSEQLSGRPVLKAFLELFTCEQILALGKIAAAQLEQLGVHAHCVRHPASGGAKLFRQQIAEIVG